MVEVLKSSSCKPKIVCTCDREKYPREDLHFYFPMLRKLVLVDRYYRRSTIAHVTKINKILLADNASEYITYSLFFGFDFM